MNNVLTDETIRAALDDADSKGKLGIVAVVTGIPGGVQELHKIMDSDGELSIIDRAMLGIHIL